MLAHLHASLKIAKTNFSRDFPNHVAATLFTSRDDSNSRRRIDGRHHGTKPGQSW
jgi:hypothetical protein